MARDAGRVSTLVLVLAAHARPYASLVRTIKRTWASVRVDGIETFFFLGGRELRLRGRDLLLPVPDDLAHTGAKTLACLEYVLAERDPDLVFRTNCSSYVDLPNLDAFVRALGRPRGLYGGRTGVHEGIRFASGSGYLLSRDLVELVVERRAEWDHSLLDDVALGALLRRYAVEPRELRRQDLTSLEDVSQADLSQFHFRCKSTEAGRRDDAAIMVALHRAFCRARGVPFRPGALVLPIVARQARGAMRSGLSRARRAG